MDVVLRSLIIFIAVWALIRLSGKREIAQLNAFDMVLLVVIGDLVAQAIVQEDYSLTAAIIAVSTIAMASMLVARLAFLVPALQPFINDRPRAMILQGKIDHTAMRAERLTRAELDEAARQNGFVTLADVDVCVLEVDGNFSFYRKATTPNSEE